MKGMRNFMSAQLFGLKALPHESGAWGEILPRGSEPEVYEPDAKEEVQNISPAMLTFIDGEMSIDRGMLIVFGVFVSTFMLALATSFGPVIFKNEPPPAVLMFVFAFFALAIIGPAFAIYRMTNDPIRPPAIFSKKLRKVYVWQGKKGGWKSFDFDLLYPFIFRAQVVSTAGAATIYTLQLAVLDANRRIVHALVAAPPSRLPAECGRRWEFIRRYMNEPPARVPPVLVQPSVDDRRATLARMDRVGFAGLIDREFKLDSSAFARCYYFFYGIVGYWWLRAAAWVQRKGPRPEYPEELVLAAAMGENPYVREPLSGMEKAAFEGRLGHLNFRWAIIGIISTLLWGGAWLALVVGLTSLA